MVPRTKCRSQTEIHAHYRLARPCPNMMMTSQTAMTKHVYDIMIMTSHDRVSP